VGLNNKPPTQAQNDPPWSHRGSARNVSLHDYVRPRPRTCEPRATGRVTITISPGTPIGARLRLLFPVPGSDGRPESSATALTADVRGRAGSRYIKAGHAGTSADGRPCISARPVRPDFEGALIFDERGFHAYHPASSIDLLDPAGARLATKDFHPGRTRRQSQRSRLRPPGLPHFLSSARQPHPVRTSSLKFYARGKAIKRPTHSRPFKTDPTRPCSSNASCRWVLAASHGKEGSYRTLRYWIRY